MTTFGTIFGTFLFYHLAKMVLGIAVQFSKVHLSNGRLGVALYTFIPFFCYLHLHGKWPH